MGSARGALPLRLRRKRRHRGKRCKWVRLWRTGHVGRWVGERSTWLVVRCFHILYIASNGQCTSRKSQNFAKYFNKIISKGILPKAGCGWFLFYLKILSWNSILQGEGWIPFVAIEPRGFTRNDESPLLIPCSGPIYNLSLHLNLPGFYLYL